MPPRLQKPIHFGSFLVNAQVFHVTSSSFALVNLKPLLPGHVLVSPLRIVPRISDLSHDEVSDLFLTAQRISRTLGRVYSASGFNIAVQDGKAAGQSVPHVHVHIIPRKVADMDKRGGSDAIYGLMDGPEGDIGSHQRQQANFAAPDADRNPRSEEEMRKEAKWLAEEYEKDNPEMSKSNNELD